ncbi:MAG TPA: cytochrome c biogenesis protein CcsA [Pyrinomonadaceae bacterium]|jgi:ABC-type transport system involved in cytochrome c biogenesis permease subunit
MSEVLDQPTGLALPDTELVGSRLRSYLPAILAVAGSLLMVGLRVKLGGGRFISDGALMMLALACYLTAAVFHLMNLYAPSEMAQRVGRWTATAGVFFNLSSWGVRWIAAHDRELAILTKNGYGPEQMPWFFRYIPFANLYDLSLAFAFGAGITTLLIAHRKSFRSLGAVTLPMASLILLLARFIGDEFIDLPPILDSYWRPIHVGIASLSYGVALVCFAVAVLYLLKDGVKTETMAIWSSIFALAVLATVSKYSVFTSLTYSASTFLQTATGGRRPIPLRVDIPWVGPMLALAGLLLVGTIIAFGIYLSKNDLKARAWGHRLLKLSLVVQAAAIAFLVSQIKTLTDIGPRIQQKLAADPLGYERLGRWMAEQEGMKPEQIAALPVGRLEEVARQFVAQSGSKLFLSLNANPVELAALITAFAATLFVIIFSFRTERLRASLPSREKLDSLMYKTASVAFAMLAMLLITGAVWANESWGRYWGWDSKETGALVAWLTYAAFLHTRISRGWSGRSSAYFALIGFLLVIFTYLGVSYLLPGLHSYA